MMNGVERTSGSIPVNGSLLFKSCRFTFLGPEQLQQERSVYPGASTLRKLAAAPALASLATVILLTLGLVDLGTSGFFRMPAPRPAMAGEQETHAVPSPIAEPDPVGPASAEPDPVGPASAMPDPVDPASAMPDLLVPSPDPEPIPRTVVVPLRSAVRPEPIKPLPERGTGAEVAKKTVVVPLRSAVRPEPIKPLPERSTREALTKQTMAVPPRLELRLEPELRPAPVPPTRLIPPPHPAPRIVGPGQLIPDERIDVLFIHAHPDDESIDFGTLMALCKEAGLTTAMVLLTDGEGGIYQQDYTGPRDNMVSIRVQEATTAMQFLGTSLYIRLGLKNSPYNSLLEEKGVQEVLQLWDGDAVALRLGEIINTLRPRVVVSPEGPSFAREHFEHEATGVLTLMALQEVRRQGGHVPEAHLVSVDPRQKDAYTGLTAFPRQRVLERQRQALLSHATQADATYFGVQMVAKYDEEYYLIRFWDMAVHYSRYFGIAAGQPLSVPTGAGPFLVHTDTEESQP